MREPGTSRLSKMSSVSLLADLRAPIQESILFETTFLFIRAGRCCNSQVQILIDLTFDPMLCFGALCFCVLASPAGRVFCVFVFWPCSPAGCVLCFCVLGLLQGELNGQRTGPVRPCACTCTLLLLPLLLLLQLLACLTSSAHTSIACMALHLCCIFCAAAATSIAAVRA